MRLRTETHLQLVHATVSFSLAIAILSTLVVSVLATAEDDELAPYRLRGESAITGRVFLETPNGEVVLAAQQAVRLMPATERTKRLAQVQVVENNEMLETTADGLWWTTKTGQDGRFVFNWLPAGDYLVLSEVVWSPTSRAGRQNSIAYALVRVGEREHVDVVVKRTVTDLVPQREQSPSAETSPPPAKRKSASPSVRSPRSGAARVPPPDTPRCPPFTNFCGSGCCPRGYKCNFLRSTCIPEGWQSCPDGTGCPMGSTCVTGGCQRLY